MDSQMMIETFQLGTDSSPFGKLSGEMRNMIYRLALLSEASIGMDAADKRTDPRRFRPALLETCQQFRNEATSIFYLNEFHATCSLEEKPLTDLRLMTKDKASKIETFTITISVACMKAAQIQMYLELRRRSKLSGDTANQDKALTWLQKNAFQPLKDFVRHVVRAGVQPKCIKVDRSAEGEDMHPLKLDMKKLLGYACELFVSREKARREAREDAEEEDDAAWFERVYG